MLDEYPDILTVKEVREILFIDRGKAYDMLKSGKTLLYDAPKRIDLQKFVKRYLWIL